MGIDAGEDQPLKVEGAKGDWPEESLYDLALRTYWTLRRQEPTWAPPRWRVWISDTGGRNAGGGGSSCR